MEGIKALIEKREFKKIAEQSHDWFIEHDYVYSPVFGWEKASVVNMFRLNPHATSIPTELKPEWVEVKAKGKDKYGNTVSGEDKTEWVKHETKKKWYVADNYLSYIGYKQARAEREEMAKLIPLPEY